VTLKKLGLNTGNKVTSSNSNTNTAGNNKGNNDIDEFEFVDESAPKTSNSGSGGNNAFPFFDVTSDNKKSTSSNNG
jgi:hypothetical protein